MAIEAVKTWNQFNRDKGNHSTEFYLFYDNLENMAECRNWSLLPSQFSRYIISLYSANNMCEAYLFDFSRFCSSPEDNSPYHVIGCVDTCEKPSTVLSKEAKLIFYFKHPSVTSCNIPGECGFILKTVPSEAALWTLRLCTEKEDYLNEQVHFHDEIRAENMHIFFHHEWEQCSIISNYSNYIIFPLSWLGGLAAYKIKTLECRRSIGPDSRFKVLYKFK